MSSFKLPTNRLTTGKIADKIRNILLQAGEPRLRLIWFSLWLLSILGLCDVPGDLLRPIPGWLQWTVILMISAMKGVVLTLLYVFCRKFRFLKIIYWIAFGLYALLCVSNAVGMAIYGMGISHKMLVIISQTNNSEISEFFPTLFANLFAKALSLATLGTIAGVVILWQIIRRLSYRVYGYLIMTSGFVGLIAMLFALYTLRDGGANNMILSLRTLKCIVEVRNENRTIDEMMSKLDRYKNGDKVTSTHKAATVLYIVGESASRGHLSIYDYPLETSPQMEKISDSLFLFDNAIGSSAQTVGNIERLLSLKRDKDTGKWWDYPLLFDIIKSAGYHTSWLSNQERSGKWGSGAGVLASCADVVRYLGKESSEDATINKYDDVLLQPLKEALTDTAQYKFIGLHLMGSHIRYISRYPQSRNFFTADDEMKAFPGKDISRSKYGTIAEYDNSLRYTDSIVSVMFDYVLKLDEPAIAVYLSDHGQNVYDDGTEYVGHSPKFVDVPLVICVNEEYRRQNPDIVEMLRNSLHRSVSTSALPFVLMTLTGTNCPEYNPTEDFISGGFVERKRYVDNKPW